MNAWQGKTDVIPLLDSGLLSSDVGMDHHEYDAAQAIGNGAGLEYGSFWGLKAWLGIIEFWKPSIAVSPMYRDPYLLEVCTNKLYLAASMVQEFLLVDVASMDALEVLPDDPKIVPLVRCGHRDRYLSIPPWMVAGRRIWVNRAPFLHLWRQVAEFHTAGARIDGIIHGPDVLREPIDRHQRYVTPTEREPLGPFDGRDQREASALQSVCAFWDSAVAHHDGAMDGQLAGDQVGRGDD